MEKILCYGDSNTFGYNPLDGSRYSEDKRWSGILKSNFKNQYETIEAGLNNRKAFIGTSCELEYYAKKHLPIILNSFSDIKILILAIGTNDFQANFDIKEKDVEDGLNYLINLAFKKNISTIIIPPIKLDENILKGNFSCLFNQNSIIKSEKIIPIYRKIALETKTKYLDLNNLVKPSKIDGLHYDKEMHFKIAQKLTNLIKHF